VREDTTRAREEAAKAREDLAPLLARVKELEKDVALVGGQRDALNIASKPWRTRLRYWRGRSERGTRLSRAPVGRLRR
jgi:hypothetical protein